MTTALTSSGASATGNEEAARLHIEEIRTQKFSIGAKQPNLLTQDLHHAVIGLSAELYTKGVHFLMELLQNAEDNEYKEGVEPTLELVLTRKDITGSGAHATLLVFNNEIGFTRTNIDSICSVGRSTKKGKRQSGFIGEKGNGFKSVFLVSTEPHIFSNGYKVRFSEEPNQDCGVGYIVPEWVRDQSYLSSIHEVYGSNKVMPTTIIVLPLRHDKVDAVRAQLSELHPELLLFLSKIKRLSVRGYNSDPEEAENVTTISIASESNLLVLRDERADSRVACLSVQEKADVTEEMNQYYIWRQVFPVKPGNKVTARKDVEEWVISLAFPLRQRPKRTSPIGIFAFLPTTMITNFPFVIQADFLLASSWESILLDNIWNLGILECVPSAFLNAFTSYVKEVSKFSSFAQAFMFLPAEASFYPVLNKVRESIRTMLQVVDIVPCDLFFDKIKFCRPACAIRILPNFRKLLLQMGEQGVPYSGSSSLKMNILHFTLDLKENTKILDFLGVGSLADSHAWYLTWIQTCNFLMSAPEDVYVELLCFIADNKKIYSSTSFQTCPLIRYISADGKMGLCPVLRTIRNVYKVQYAMEVEHHIWLSKCNMEFRCQNDTFFLPDLTQKALVSHRRSSFLLSWLSCYAGVRSCSVSTYTYHVQNILCVKKDLKLAITFAHFLYHSHLKKFLTDSWIKATWRNMPIIDGRGCIRTQRTMTLVSSPGSKWAKLFGSRNPFPQEDYIDLGEVYAHGQQFSGECTPENKLLAFLSEQCGAMDLPELHPPNTPLPVASSKMTSEQAFLLLDWIRFLRTSNCHIPGMFIESIRDGKWVKTYSGFRSPSQSIIPDETGKIIFETMKDVLDDDVSVLDQEFYTDRISLYADELKFLGVRFGSDDVQKLIATRFKSLSSSAMSRESAFSLLIFIGISKQRNMLDELWLEVIMAGKWLMTSKGFDVPRGSVFLQSETEAEAVLTITNLPVVDQSFYGSKIGFFSSELMQLGVVLNSEKIYKLIVENLTFHADLYLRSANSGLLILKCIRYLRSATKGMIEKIKAQPWLKTCSGIVCPANSILSDPTWGLLLSIVEVPIIDEAFYGNEIRSFVAELGAVGVAVNFESAFKTVVAQFKSLSRFSRLTPVNVKSLLDYIRQISQTMPLIVAELCEYLCVLNWLKTRHGYKTPKESILFSPKWGTISLFVDLPLIDDGFYSIGIYEYKDELKMMGVVIDIEAGASFVANGLQKPIKSVLITGDGSISLLECTKSLMSASHDQSSVIDFLNNLMRSKWLKTRNGYQTPADCIFLDPSWEGILEETDAPTIDKKFYVADISMFKNQLRAIGVKVDSGEVCSLLFRHLLSHTRTSSITRIYGFINKFRWNPESLDKYNSQVWIPNKNGTDGGKWVSSHLCLLHDKDNLFTSIFYCLDNYYVKDLLPMFSSVFGVVESPSLDSYIQLWSNWELRENHQVTATECYSFWAYILDNWNPHMEETLKQNISKLPATASSGTEVFLVNKDEVFIADDLQLKKSFLSIDGIPLFVWFPKCSGLSSVPLKRLYAIYCSLGVRKISVSIKCNVNSILPSGQLKKVDPRICLVGKGLIKILLAFLAGPMINMSVEERHRAALSLLNLTVFESDHLIQDTYQLVLSPNTALKVKVKKVVLWEKSSRRLLIDKSSYEDRKIDIEFVTCYAREIAEGIVAKEGADAVNNLSKIIQMGFMFEFKEAAVDFYLTRENLEVFIEDEEFLEAAFPSTRCSPVLCKRTCHNSELSAPSTPATSLVHVKKQRQ